MIKSIYGVAAVAACFNINAMDKMPQEFFRAHRVPETKMQRVSLSKIERINPLSSKEEMDNYLSTWNKDLSLGDNLFKLCQSFLDACCLFFEGEGDFVINQANGKQVIYNKMPQEKTNYFVAALQRISCNPVGCQLIRLLLTKYLSGTTASRFSKAYIVSSDEKGKFRFGHGSTETQEMCVIPVSYVTDDISSLFAGVGIQQAQEMIGRSKSITQINGFSDMFFFNENIERDDDVSLFGAMLRWFHHVSGVDIKSLTRSADAILKRYARPESAFLSNKKAYESALIEHFSDDYFFRCMYGFVYDKASDSMKIDPLNESAYTSVKNNTIRVFCSYSDKTDADFTGSLGDEELLAFYLNKQIQLPKFGQGQYKYKISN